LLRVGLTGGIACGKTTVGRMFEELGARLIEADVVAHQLMRPGQRVYNEVVQHFGPEILSEDGSIHRGKLAQAAFGNGRVEELNRLVHPAVLAGQEEWLARMERSNPGAVAMVEAALILEAGVGRRFDKLVVVTCRPEQKVERFAARHGLGREAAQAEVERRQAAQWPDAEKVAAADYVVDNSGTLEETRRQVGAIYAELAALAEATHR
jgi:dephospho-CoA kinase